MAVSTKTGKNVASVSFVATNVILLAMPLPLPPPPAPGGILAESNTPDVMSEVERSGSLAESKVPDVILEVARLGILASSNEPDVILDAARFGISLVPRDNLADGTVPLPNSDAFSDVRDAPDPFVNKSVPVPLGKVTVGLPPKSA